MKISIRPAPLCFVSGWTNGRHGIRSNCLFFQSHKVFVLKMCLEGKRRFSVMAAKRGNFFSDFTCVTLPLPLSAMDSGQPTLSWWWCFAVDIKRGKNVLSVFKNADHVQESMPILEIHNLEETSLPGKRSGRIKLKTYSLFGTVLVKYDFEWLNRMWSRATFCCCCC